MAKTNTDYYNEIDKALKSYEQYKPYHSKNIEWICNRITWCFKFRKISAEQMDELADRSILILNSGLI